MVDLQLPHISLVLLPRARRVQALSHKEVGVLSVVGTHWLCHLPAAVHIHGTLTAGQRLPGLYRGNSVHRQHNLLPRTTLVSHDPAHPHRRS